MKFYECSTCKHVNGVWRLHCAVCCTTPAMYSITGKPELSIMPAYGAEPVKGFRVARVNLKTVELDYYAGA